jgi:hypothetical protein
MKQQKFFVGDKVVRTQYRGSYEPINGSIAIVTAVELDEEDNNIYLRFKDSPSEKWDADYFTIVERVWQENIGVQPVPDGVKVFYQYEGMPPEEHPTDADNLEWECPCDGIIRWRIADNYEEEPADEEELVAVESSSVPFHVISNKGLVAVDVQKKNKYTREIKPNVFVDVYDVLRAFNVTDPCLSHLAKKALAAGQRHHKDRLTDLQDIKASIERAIEMHIEWEK